MEFFRRCGQTKGGTTLRAIQSLADEFGVKISLMSATAVRDGPLAEYLDELKATSQMAESVAALAKNGVGLSDGAASAFAAKVFDAARNVTADDIGTETGNNISLAIARLRTGDRNAKKLEADLKLRDEQLAILQRERTEWEEQRAKIVAVSDKVRAATPATADEVRAKAVAAIDEIMGIKPKK